MKYNKGDEGMESDKLLLSVDEVAKILNLSRATIYSMVENKQIPFVRIGKKEGRIFFIKSSIEKWLLNKEKKTS